LDKLRIGLVGCGGIASGRHVPAIAALPDAEITAICDVNEKCASDLAEKIGVKHVFSDYHKMLEMGELDAIDICTPNFLHMPPALAAFDVGKHVIVEKPIGLNAHEAQKMVDAGRKAKKKLMVAQCMRFTSESQALKRFIDAGKMGEMYYARVKAIRRRGVPSWGFFIDKEKQGGGPLIDIGVHILDLTLWLMGHPKVKSVSGAAYVKFGNKPGVFNSWGSWDHTKFTVEDFASGFVRFENGATLTIESSFAANIDKDQMDLAIMGTEGGCQTSPVKMFREEHGSLYDLSPVNLPQVNNFEGEMRAFVDCIKNDTEPAVTGEQALMVMKILDGIYKSSETGAEVAVD
jgi:predicted dehydrogenase